MATNKSAQYSADKMYKSEGAARPPKWERGRPRQMTWCNLCHDHTEHDHLGCVECYDPARDVDAESSETGAEREEETK